MVGNGGNVLTGGAGRDLLIAGLTASQLDGGEGNGDGTLQFGNQYDTGTPYGIASGDFNGDGDRDIAVANFTNGGINLWSGNGDGRSMQFETRCPPVAIASVDASRRPYI